MNRREVIAGVLAAPALSVSADTGINPRKCLGWLVCKADEIEAAKELCARGARAMLGRDEDFKIIVKPIVSKDWVLESSDGTSAVFRCPADADPVFRRGEEWIVMSADLIDCYTVAWSYRAPRGFSGRVDEFGSASEFLETSRKTNTA